MNNSDYSSLFVNQLMALGNTLLNWLMKFNLAVHKHFEQCFSNFTLVIEVGSIRFKSNKYVRTSTKTTVVI